ncbi:MAG TPA: response regulator transcription factor [Pyrinomonadaceae bacterium]|nr:response regulator transcription factor [Pyrinomonadaceae bacterium]
MTVVEPKPPSVLIVCDQLMICDALKTLVESHGIPVTSTASGEVEALDGVTAYQPKIVLLDLNLQREHIAALIKRLNKSAPKSRILLLTAVEDQEMRQKAMQSGAMGVICKHQSTDVLIKAIKKINDGEVWIDRTTMGSVLAQMTRVDETAAAEDEKIKSLTDREHQVITLIAEGLRNKQIANRMRVSETTVTHHLSSIFSKLEVSDRLELVIYAFGHGLARIPH